MSVECAECEHDIRGGHDEGCSRYTFAPKVGQLVYSADYGESTVEWVDDEQMEARICNFMGMVAHQRFDQLEPAPSITVPALAEDGTLALPCGSLYSGADLADWRTDHLPGCGICLGNFGNPNERK